MQNWMNLNYISNDVRLDPDYYAIEIQIEKYFSNQAFVLLEDIAEIVTDGTRNAKSFVDEGIPYLRIANLTPPTINKTKLIHLPSYEGIEERAVVCEGDILLSKTGSFDKMLWAGSASAGMVLGPDIIRIKLKHPEDAPLLLGFFQSPVGRMLIKQSVVGTTIPRLSASDLRRMRVPIFNQEERSASLELYQKQQNNKEDIASLLYKWNDSYEKYSADARDEVLPDSFFIQTDDIDSNRLDFKYYQLQLSRFNFELVERMNLEEWTVLESVAEIVQTTLRPGDWKGRFVKYIGLGNVKPETFVVSEVEDVEYRKVAARARYVARENDIILGIIGPYIGERSQSLAVITKEWENSLISSAFAVIRCRDINPYYILWCLQHPLVRYQLRRLTRGQVQNMVSVSDINKINIPLLRDDEQKNISGIATALIQALSPGI